MEETVISSQHQTQSEALANYSHPEISFEDGPSEVEFEWSNFLRLGAIKERPVNSAMAGSI